MAKTKGGGKLQDQGSKSVEKPKKDKTSPVVPRKRVKTPVPKKVKSSASENDSTEAASKK